jgi:hypothetical protein
MQCVAVSDCRVVAKFIASNSAAANLLPLLTCVAVASGAVADAVAGASVWPYCMLDFSPAVGKIPLLAASPAAEGSCQICLALIMARQFYSLRSSWPGLAVSAAGGVAQLLHHPWTAYRSYVVDVAVTVAFNAMHDGTVLYSEVGQRCPDS